MSIGDDEGTCHIFCIVFVYVLGVCYCLSLVVVQLIFLFFRVRKEQLVDEEKVLSLSINYVEIILRVNNCVEMAFAVFALDAV